METKKRALSTRAKVHIILDSAGYHRSQLVKDFAQLFNIELHYLPPYSPNLNPNRATLEGNARACENNVYFPTKVSFKDAINNFFDVTLPKFQVH